MSTSTSQDESESVSKLSARLLAGWTMLSETCPRRGCSLPLMRSRSKDEISCVGCEQRYTKDFQPVDEVDGGPSTPSRNGYAGASTSASQTPTSRVRQGSKAKASSDDSSKTLAEKLLLGWTLTDQYCPVPNCLTPLVRNKERQMFCVTCNAWLVKDGQTGALAPPQASPSPSPAPAHAPTAVARANAIHGARDRADVCDRALHVLFQKMLLCTEALDQSGNVMGDQCAHLVGLMSTIVGTIGGVQSVQRDMAA